MKYKNSNMTSNIPKLPLTSSTYDTKNPPSWVDAVNSSTENILIQTHTTESEYATQ